ncbi:MAG: enoyl-CoA hydratase/isomerase family protein [Deltaproteobacteria bacterium]|nr:enoyl-CoA hydratase/isomerase family protein [Deltaproteobacteria bacterium]
MNTTFVRRDNLDKNIAILTLNDTSCRNAMSEKMATDFSARITELRSEGDVRVLIIKGAGDVFSAGGHLDMLLEKPKMSEERNRQLMEVFYKQFLSIIDIEIPVIAAINGHAIGAGLCLTLGCDIRIAVESAKVGFNFVRIGLHPGMGATHLLPRLIGSGYAAELLYTGKIIGANDAAKIGLINHSVGQEQFDTFVNEMATSIAQASPQAVRQLKSSLRTNPLIPLSDSLKREAQCQAADYAGNEFKEGINAIIEKRSPRF